METKGRRRGKWTEEEKRLAREARAARLRDAYKAEWRERLAGCDGFSQAVEATQDYIHGCLNDDCADVSALDGELGRILGWAYSYDCPGLYATYAAEVRFAAALRDRGILAGPQAVDAVRSLVRCRFLGELRAHRLDRWADAFESGDYTRLAS